MIKRIFDVVVTVLMVLTLWPVMIVLALLIRYKLGGPILFCQVRPGLNGQPFKMYKFRSMTDERDENGELLPDSVRLTSFGKLLRASSLDELPELWNVLKGEMSLVGPRPLLMEYLPLYSTEQMRRHEVRPGITGWAQVNGRNAISWQQKFELDVWYVGHQTLWLDLKVLFLTAYKIVKRSDISSDTSATMEKFEGNR
ncbi:sugar transferase [Echinimonas agarilytica]